MEKQTLTGMTLESPSFADKDFIPVRFTCDGDNINPHINIRGLPKEARTLVLMLDDPDAPIRTWNHWIVWNIPTVEEIYENTIPGIEGLNDFNQHDYSGPCPPDSKIHHYYFKIYALDGRLNLGPGARKRDVEKAMAGRTISCGKLMGLYVRKKRI